LSIEREKTQVVIDSEYIALESLIKRVESNITQNGILNPI